MMVSAECRKNLLTYPGFRKGGQTRPGFRIEPVDCFKQSHGPFLHKILEGEANISISGGYKSNKSDAVFDESPSGGIASLGVSY
jgi:hypothetical protein